MQPKTIVCRIFLTLQTAQCSLLSKKNPIIRIFCIYEWLAVRINPDKVEFHKDKGKVHARTVLDGPEGE
jgi:hypothetical protein